MLQLGAENILAKILCIYCLHIYGWMHHDFYPTSACKCIVTHTTPVQLIFEIHIENVPLSFHTFPPPRGKGL